MAQLTANSLKPDFTFEDFKSDVDAWFQAEDKWLKELPQKVRKEGKGDAVGTIMRWGVADGSALYIVVKQKPLTLSHIEIGDAYRIPYMMIRGCRLSDVRDAMKEDGPR